MEMFEMTIDIYRYTNPPHMDRSVDIRERYGLAREGELHLSQWDIRFPNLLFLSTERFPAPRNAEILLTRDQKYEKPYFSDSGSFFAEIEGTGPLVIPPNIPTPHGTDRGDMPGGEPSVIMATLPRTRAPSRSNSSRVPWPTEISSPSSPSGTVPGACTIETAGKARRCGEVTSKLQLPRFQLV